MRAVQVFNISERRACSAIGLNRSIIRYIPKKRDDEEELRADIISMASRYGRYGYLKICELLKAEGWIVNHKRVERIWREEGLKVPKKQKKRSRLYFNDGSCLRLRPLHKNHVWSYDFVEYRLHRGKKIRMLTVIDEYTRKGLMIKVEFRLNSQDVLDALYKLFITEGILNISGVITAQNSLLRRFRIG